VENVVVLGSGGEVKVVLHSSSFHETSAKLLGEIGVVRVIFCVAIGEE
jgi:hypothetical protein